MVQRAWTRRSTSKSEASKGEVNSTINGLVLAGLVALIPIRQSPFRRQDNSAVKVMKILGWAIIALLLAVLIYSSYHPMPVFNTTASGNG